MTFEVDRAYGATKQSDRSPLRTALMELMKGVANPHSPEDRKTIRADFRQQALNDEEILEEAIEHAFTNNYRSLLDYFPIPGAPSRANRIEASRRAAQQRAERIKEGAVQAAAATAQSILLDLVLPNGKALRDCTGRECRRMSTKMSPWLARIADKLKPGEIVGTVLQEAEVRKLYERRN
jgi:hypothetical protein